jgi:hypothetical protein
MPCCAPHCECRPNSRVLLGPIRAVDQEADPLRQVRQSSQKQKIKIKCAIRLLRVFGSSSPANPPIYLTNIIHLAQFIMLCRGGSNQIRLGPIGDRASRPHPSKSWIIAAPGNGKFILPSAFVLLHRRWLRSRAPNGGTSRLTETEVWRRCRGTHHRRRR